MAGCDDAKPKPPTPVKTADAQTYTPQFHEISKQAGIDFTHNTGAFGKYWMPETMGAGCVWFDYNGDGRPDLYVVNGTDWPGHPAGGQTTGHLYRNDGGGKFTDVTKAAGLADSFYGMGACAGDYDNDGHEDLFVTGLGRNRLYHNNGNGTFTEVGQQAGVAASKWSTSAAWVDYDNDGKLDLFVCSYVDWTPPKDVICNIRDQKTYCTPEVYSGLTNKLYRNLGNGKFQDVSHAAGVDKIGKSLGVTVCDFNGDGLPDLVVTNDTTANFLYKNLGHGKFEDIATLAGIAEGPNGVARGAMGVDAGDFQGSGMDSIVIGNFSNESLSVYQNEGGEFFRDVAPQSGVAQVSKLSLTFGVLLADYDNNGWLDILTATGHVKPQIQLLEEAVRYKEPPLVFCNQGSGKFSEVCNNLGPDLKQPRVARGLATADIDGDGKLDLCMTVNGGHVCVFKNDGPTGNWVRIRLHGVKSNRDGYGTRIVGTLGGRQVSTMVRSGMSYCSQSEAVAHFGLGAAASLENVEIHWPSGQVDKFPSLMSGKAYSITEGDSKVVAVPR